MVLLFLLLSLFPKPKHSNYKVVIDKSDYELRIYENNEWIATYPVVFGNDDLGDKLKEGDKRTPDGTYHIVAKRLHKEWGCMLMLDYPNKNNIENFNKRKAKGEISPSASIGGGIGIHGTRKQEEYIIDYFTNWTDGCVALRYSEIFELYELLPIGTEVVIQL